MPRKAVVNGPCAEEGDADGGSNGSEQVSGALRISFGLLLEEPELGIGFNSGGQGFSERNSRVGIRDGIDFLSRLFLEEGMDDEGGSTFG